MTDAGHKMRRVCAWCTLELEPVACAPAQADQVSHGICPICAERLWNELPPVEAEEVAS